RRRLNSKSSWVICSGRSIYRLLLDKSGGCFGPALACRSGRLGLLSPGLAAQSLQLALQHGNLGLEFHDARFVQGLLQLPHPPLQLVDAAMAGIQFAPGRHIESAEDLLDHLLLLPFYGKDRVGQARLSLGEFVRSRKIVVSLLAAIYPQVIERAQTFERLTLF